MEIVCPKEDCLHIWKYKGSKFSLSKKGNFTTYVKCPMCYRDIAIRKGEILVDKNK